MAEETETGQGQGPAGPKAICKIEPVSINPILKEHYTSLCELAEDASARSKIPEEDLSHLEFAISYAISGINLKERGDYGDAYMGLSFKERAEYLDSLSRFYRKAGLGSLVMELMNAQANQIAEKFKEMCLQEVISDKDMERLTDAAIKVNKIMIKLGYKKPTEERDDRSSI